MKRLGQRTECFFNVIFSPPYLGEQSGPVGFYGDAGGLQEGGDLVGGDGDAVVVEDQSGVDAGQFVV